MKVDLSPQPTKPLLPTPSNIDDASFDASSPQSATMKVPALLLDGRTDVFFRRHRHYLRRPAAAQRCLVALTPLDEQTDVCSVYHPRWFAAANCLPQRRLVASTPADVEYRSTDKRTCVPSSPTIRRRQRNVFLNDARKMTPAKVERSRYPESTPSPTHQQAYIADIADVANVFLLFFLYWRRWRSRPLAYFRVGKICQPL